MKARSEATTALFSHEVDIGLSLSADLNSECLMIKSKFKGEGCLRERLNRE